MLRKAIYIKWVVLLRHGEPTGNQENRFAGWTDIDLTVKHIGEARKAGRFIRDAKVEKAIQTVANQGRIKA